MKKELTMQEEPASEGLEAFIQFTADELPQGITVTPHGDFDLTSVKQLIKDAAKTGANWQKEKDDEEKMLTYKHGFEDCKEQMMAKAVDGVIIFDYYSGDKTYGCIAHDSFCLEDFGLKDRDKVKVIVIKEE